MTLYNRQLFVYLRPLVNVPHNAASNPPKITRKMRAASGPQRGAVIHHQLQSITFVSLRTRNTRNKRLKNPVPPTVMVLLDSDMLLSPSSYYRTNDGIGK
jgi:hypothetical protein